MGARTSLAALALAVLLGAAASAGGCAARQGGGSSKSGGRPADFTLRDIDGATVRLSDHLGKDVVLISFWATWCSPCQAEMPHLERMFRSYKDQGFVVLAVSMDGP